jgi:DNA-binding transcriptional LysR family regulator
MDLRQLQAVVAIADHGSFSGAATALRTVQSNVSSHVARLERELGVQLVDRQAGQLTEEGTAVVERARRIAAELEALVADVAAMRNEVSGSVRLGMIGTTARWLAPILLRRVAQVHPNVRLVISEGTLTALEPRLVNGTLDIAVLTLPVQNRELAQRTFFDEDLLLAVGRGHPLATKDAVALTELDGMPLLLPAPGTQLREELDEAARQAGVRLSALAELDGLRLMASLAGRGFGPAILPATGAADWGDAFVGLPIEGLPRRRVGIALRRGRPSAPTRAILELLDSMTDEVTAQFGVHLPQPDTTPDPRLGGGGAEQVEAAS